jgi:hypothetical protein
MSEATPRLTAIALCGLTAGLIGAMSLAPATGQGCNDEYWTGTNDPNTRYDDGDGDFEDNHWFFLEGNDYGRSLNCSDPEIWGDAGHDNIGGGGSEDELFGDSGSDNVYGGDGNDILEGGLGDDFLQDDQGIDADILDGEDGENDIIDVADGDWGDFAYGGAGGNDECRVDHQMEKTGGCNN